MSGAVHRGACLCGAVRVTVTGDLPAPDACHCGQCRKMSGHVWASTDVDRSALTIEGAEAVRWFRSSEKVERGFCATCGSTLFWAPLGRDRIAVSMGVFDTPTATHLHMHIFTRFKGDYYEIADGVEQNP